MASVGKVGTTVVRRLAGGAAKSAAKTAARTAGSHVHKFSKSSHTMPHSKTSQTFRLRPHTGLRTHMRFDMSKSQMRFASTKALQVQLPKTAPHTEPTKGKPVSGDTTKPLGPSSNVPTSKQLDTARSIGLPDGLTTVYVTESGDILWPEDDGFVEGTRQGTTLEVGKKLERIGGDRGRFTSDEGTSFEERSILPKQQHDPVRLLEVMKPFDVEQGTVAPWFGYPGGGTQQFTGDQTIGDLIERGYLVELIVPEEK